MFDDSPPVRSDSLVKEPATDKEEGGHTEPFDDVIIPQLIRPEAIGCDMEIDDQNHGKPTYGVNIADSI